MLEEILRYAFCPELGLALREAVGVEGLVILEEPVRVALRQLEAVAGHAHHHHLELARLCAKLEGVSCFWRQKLHSLKLGELCVLFIRYVGFPVVDNVGTVPEVCGDVQDLAVWCLLWRARFHLLALVHYVQKGSAHDIISLELLRHIGEVDRGGAVAGDHELVFGWLGCSVPVDFGAECVGSWLQGALEVNISAVEALRSGDVLDGLVVRWVLPVF